MATNAGLCYAVIQATEIGAVLEYALKLAAGLAVVVAFYVAVNVAGEWAARRFDKRGLATWLPIGILGLLFIALPALAVLWGYATGRLPAP